MACPNSHSKSQVQPFRVPRLQFSPSPQPVSFTHDPPPPSLSAPGLLSAYHSTVPRSLLTSRGAGWGVGQHFLPLCPQTTPAPVCFNWCWLRSPSAWAHLSTSPLHSPPPPSATSCMTLDKSLSLPELHHLQSREINICL